MPDKPDREIIGFENGREFRFHIKKITVFISMGTDKVHIETDLPSSFPPGVSNDYLTIEFHATHGHGVEYVREYFNWEPNVIDIR